MRAGIDQLLFHSQLGRFADVPHNTILCRDGVSLSITIRQLDSSELDIGDDWWLKKRGANGPVTENQDIPRRPKSRLNYHVIAECRPNAVCEYWKAQNATPISDESQIPRGGLWSPGAFSDASPQNSQSSLSGGKASPLRHAFSSRSVL
jgi:hypothetical protein